MIKPEHIEATAQKAADLHRGMLSRLGIATAQGFQDNRVAANRLQGVSCKPLAPWMLRRRHFATQRRLGHLSTPVS